MLELESIFQISAIIGGVLFAVRVVMLFLGGLDIGGDIGDLGDADIGGDFGDGDIGHADGGLPILSLQGVMSFLLMFGLAGIASIQSGWSEGTALVISLVAGIGSMYFMALLFKSLLRLQSSGTTKKAEAIGADATVYLTIPAGGTGKISIVFHERQQVIDARSADGTEIPTGETVTVTSVKANTLHVSRQSSAAPPPSS